MADFYVIRSRNVSISKIMIEQPQNFNVGQNFRRNFVASSKAFCQRTIRQRWLPPAQTLSIKLRTLSKQFKPSFDVKIRFPRRFSYKTHFQVRSMFSLIFRLIDFKINTMKVLAILFLAACATAEIDWSQVKNVEDMDGFWEGRDPALFRAYGTSPRQGRIVNGDIAADHQFPYQVNLWNFFLSTTWNKF